MGLSINLGHLDETLCYLLNVLIVNVIADNTGNHTDDKRRENSHHSYHLLPSQIYAVVLEVVALLRL